MLNGIDTTTQLCLCASSVSVGISVFTALAPLVHAIACPRSIDVDRWHREHARWTRLRAASKLFRKAERTVVGIAYILERRAPWMFTSTLDTHGLKRVLAIIGATIFGRTGALDEAVRIRSTQQPWAASEVVATATIIAFISALSTGIVVSDLFAGFWLAGIAIAFGLGCYRFWIWRFIVQAHLRRRTIRRFLPHAIDSIAMVMNSGDPFGVGLDTVIRDFPNHPLSEEFLRLRNDLERGQTMHAALDARAQAICLPEFDEMVRVLGRVHEHGVPAAENFNRLAKQLRATHLRHMEEEVGRAEAALSFPTLCVMTACMIVALAPFVMSILQSNLFN